MKYLHTSKPTELPRTNEVPQQIMARLDAMGCSHCSLGLVRHGADSSFRSFDSTHARQWHRKCTRPCSTPGFDIFTGRGRVCRAHRAPHKYWRIVARNPKPHLSKDGSGLCLFAFNFHLRPVGESMLRTCGYRI